MQRYALAALAIVPLVFSAGVASSTVLPAKQEGPSTGYAAASAALGGLNLTTSFLNLKPQTPDGSPSWSGYAGLFGGMLGIALGGALLLDDRYDGTPLAFMNIAVGAMSTAAGVSAIMRAEKAPAEEHATAHPHSVTFSPVVHFGRVSVVGLGMRF